MKTTILSLLITYLGYSQSIEKYSIDSGGASTSADGIQMIYTIGEVNVQELSADNILLSEGFINGDMDKITLSSNNLEFGLGFKIYPNPTSNYINVESKIDVDRFEIYDLSGKKVLSSNNYEKINVEDLSKGLYLLKAFSGIKHITKKVIIE
ncbi:T9SS type A sorting domain-containing protein [Algibacter sp. L1A34]|uniref:T9SS type A sorting domain-containing protein n=1 Tax=Algibacter sp. L1A34 TaxID=2686365 RepID=UPI00131AEEA0|nr:T9SS type A sorting domain-containing protein [Algibacter sp. L1A34]